MAAECGCETAGARPLHPLGDHPRAAPAPSASRTRSSPSALGHGRCAPPWPGLVHRAPPGAPPRTRSPLPPRPPSACVALQGARAHPTSAPQSPLALRCPLPLSSPSVASPSSPSSRSEGSWLRSHGRIRRLAHSRQSTTFSYTSNLFLKIYLNPMTSSIDNPLHEEESYHGETKKQTQDQKPLFGRFQMSGSL